MSEIIVSPLYNAYSGTSGKDGSASIQYRVLGTSSLSAATSAFLSTIPRIHDGYPYKNYSYDEVGFGNWIFTANYSIDEPPKPEDFTVNFDTTGGKAKIIYSLETVGVATRPHEIAPNFHRGIGWNGERFEGVDIVVPAFKWTETHYKSLEFITRSYRRLLRQMTGTVNNEPFRDMDAGEVIFLGAQSQNKRGADEEMLWELRYSFEAQPNLTGLVYGDCEPIDKGGHDYIWIYQEPSDDQDAKKVIGKPAAVFVEQLYRRSNFANLGIGIY